MTIRGRHRLAASILLAAMGTACGGGTGTSSSGSTVVGPTARRSAPATSTTTATTTAALAPPKVVDHGDDSVAIASSLLLFGRWMKWHDPDPKLVARVYDVGSPAERVVSKDVTEMHRIGAHVVEVDDAPFELTVYSKTRNVVSLLLTEHLAHREAVAADGRVLARDPKRIEQHVISLVRPRSGAAWRMNRFELRHARFEVQL
jgi:hypothetical protein